MQNHPSRRTLDATPERALRFLAAVGRSRAIRGALSPYGYDAATHDEGWRHLHAASGYAPQPAPAQDVDAVIAQAQAWLDAFDNQWFPVAAVSLRFRHPGAHAALFDGDLQVEDGVASLRAVRVFLDRLDALDAAARATLAQRGLTPDRLAEARDMLALAETPAELPPPPVDPEAPDPRLPLWAWLTEWTTIARTAIRRRDHLIRLGLAQRRTRKRAPEIDGAAAPEGEPAPA